MHFFFYVLNKMPQNILDMYITSTSGTYLTNLAKPIKQQTMRIAQIRVQYDTSAHALADKFVIVTCPRWLGGNCANFGSDGNNTLSDKRGIIIPLENADVTVKEPNYYIDMSDDCPQSFNFQVFGLNGNTGLDSVLIKFEYDYGDI
jgi:hypothetical protein